MPVNNFQTHFERDVKMKTHITIAILILSISVLLLLSCGCEEHLRFAPSESQKKLAWQSHITARDIEASGTDAHSPAAKQQVESTVVSLKYIGLPKDPVIVDYATTAAQAQADAAKRPAAGDVLEQVEGGLSLAAELAILFGVGSAGFGGKRLLDWLKLAREKNKALKEIVQGNEFFKQNLSSLKLPVGVLKAFKNAQNAAQQSQPTKRLVTELKP